MKIDNNNGGGGVGFVGLLTIVFIVLKLLNVIEWSWWWVLSPVWISASLVIATVLIVLIVAYILGCIEEYRDENKDD